MIRIPARRLLAIALLLLPASACLDGPFAHANPNDPDADVQLSIAGGVDTARVQGDYVLFQLVTDPVSVGRTVGWDSTDPLRLQSLGSGSFYVLSLPLAPTTVTIGATIGSHRTTRNVVLMPAQ